MSATILTAQVAQIAPSLVAMNKPKPRIKRDAEGKAVPKAKPKPKIIRIKKAKQIEFSAEQKRTLNTWIREIESYENSYFNNRSSQYGFIVDNSFEAPEDGTEETVYIHENIIKNAEARVYRANQKGSSFYEKQDFVVGISSIFEGMKTPLKPLPNPKMFDFLYYLGDPYFEDTDDTETGMVRTRKWKFSPYFGVDIQEQDFFERNEPNDDDEEYEPYDEMPYKSVYTLIPA